MRYLIIIVVSLFPAIGYTCSCSGPYEFSERHVFDQLCAADAVFVGDIERSLNVRDQVHEYKVWPRESFKGRLNSPTFALSMVGGMCGYPFKTSGRYLIFANHHAQTNYLSASVCGPTRLLERDDPVYAVLEDSKANIDEICGREAVEARRLERLREKDESFEQLMEDTRDLLDTDE
jgi:hypothetical protein